MRIYIYHISTSVYVRYVYLNAITSSYRSQRERARNDVSSFIRVSYIRMTVDYLRILEYTESNMNYFDGNERDSLFYIEVQWRV